MKRKRQQDKGQKRAVFIPSRAGIPSSFLFPFLSIPLCYFPSLRAVLIALCPRSLPRYEKRRWTDDSKRVTRLSMQPDIRACSSRHRTSTGKRGKRTRKESMHRGPLEVGCKLQKARLDEDTDA